MKSIEPGMRPKTLGPTLNWIMLFVVTVVAGGVLILISG